MKIDRQSIKKYSRYRLGSMLLLSAIYLLIILLFAYGNTYSLKDIKKVTESSRVIIQIIGVVVVFFNFWLIQKQFYHYKKIIVPLIMKVKKNNLSYIDDVMKFRSSANVIMSVESVFLILILLIIIISIFNPILLFKYFRDIKSFFIPISIIAAMIFYYFSSIQYLDKVYWKHYRGDYINLMNEILK
ncbi:hypothetical protein EFT44_01485 [Leuconostoc falkenbergense]|nr:hypothetical protein [Leuconostoc falkenbergense]